MQFRYAVLEDLKKIVEIYNSVVPTRMVTADLEPIAVESRLKWFEEHTPESRPLWVLEAASGEMLGWVSFQNYYNRPAYSITVEVSIYLDVAARGRGIGKFVLNFAVEQARQLGIENIVGLIFGHNEPSLRLFRWAAFEQWGYLPDVTILDGIRRSVVIMGKKLV
jgi:L-amino acid N-acyltransferase YncA